MSKIMLIDGTNQQIIKDSFSEVAKELAGVVPPLYKRKANPQEELDFYYLVQDLIRQSFVKSRNQVNYNHFLNLLERHPSIRALPNDVLCAVVLPVDLFVPKTNWIFGEYVKKGERNFIALS